MGKKKKFVDKKTSATFALVFQDWKHSEGDHATDRVFVRTHGNGGCVPGFDDGEPEIDADGEADSRFGDAAESSDEGTARHPEPRSRLSAQARQELLALGFPDDGYDYTQHLRSIGHTAPFVPTSIAVPQPLRPDVKVYDASALPVAAALEVENLEVQENAVIGEGPAPRLLPHYAGLDRDVLDALEDAEDSEADFDDDFDDYFVVRANDGASSVPVVARNRTEPSDDVDSCSDEDVSRPTRLLDSQFDKLVLEEYEEDDNFSDEPEDPAPFAEADVHLLHEALTGFRVLEPYKTPSEARSNKPVRSKDILVAVERSEAPASRRVTTAAPEFPEDEDLVFADAESDDEYEVLLTDEEAGKGEEWDCQSVVSTFSNLDNHPLLIEEPAMSGKMRRVPSGDPKALQGKESVIKLGGKQRLPLDYLPGKSTGGPLKDASSGAGSKAPGKQKRDPNQLPVISEDRKAHKAAVKEERRKARVAKKTLKLQYREAHLRAQHGAACAILGATRLS